MKQVICILLGAVLAGCATHWPEVDRKLETPTQTYHAAPKDLLTRIKAVITAPPLALGIDEEKDGSILTGYQMFSGEWHVARRWQERTRYRITVIPDWNDPTAAARMEVREMTEERAGDGMTWTPAPELQRPERARELLKTLDAELGARKGSA